MCKYKLTFIVRKIYFFVYVKALTSYHMYAFSILTIKPSCCTISKDDIFIASQSTIKLILSDFESICMNRILYSRTNSSYLRIY